MAEPTEPADSEPDSEVLTVSETEVAPPTVLPSPDWHSPTVMPTEWSVVMPPPLESVKAAKDVDDSLRSVKEIHKRLEQAIDEYHRNLQEAEQNGRQVAPAVEHKLAVLRAARAAEGFRHSYANLLKSGPESFRFTSSHLGVDHVTFTSGVSRKADTKPKRVLMQLSGLLDLLSRMRKEGLNRITEAGKLVFEPRWLSVPTWFVTANVDEPGRLEFFRFEFPDAPHLGHFEINVDYAAGAELIRLGMPSGSNRHKAWADAIDWIIEVMIKAKQSAASKIRSVQVPPGFDTDYTHETMLPCIVWVGEASSKRKEPRQATSHRATPYGMPASSSHQGHRRGHGQWWQDPQPPEWQASWQSHWWQGTWPGGHQ